jgi:hypothetical protein
LQKSSFQQGMNLASIFIGQMAVFRHGSPTGYCKPGGSYLIWPLAQLLRFLFERALKIAYTTSTQVFLVAFYVCQTNR